MSHFREGLGRLEARHRLLLGILGATSFFDGYDRGIINAALPQIRSSFHLSQARASLWIAFMFAGAIPAVILSRRADRVGRRRMLLWSIAGFTIATGLTAITPTLATYASAQLVAQFFLTTETAIVWAFAAEEVPAESRGLGFGWLAMNSALGFGASSLLYGVLLEPSGVSWRWLYAIGLPPLGLVAVARLRLPESGRFVAARTRDQLSATWRKILEPPHLGWLGRVMLVALLFELTDQASVFAVDFMQTQRHLSSAASNLTLVAAGLPGIPLMVLAGSLSDRWGRQKVGCTCGAISLVGGIGFFWLRGGGWRFSCPASCFSWLASWAPGPHSRATAWSCSRPPCVDRPVPGRAAPRSLVTRPAWRSGLGC